MIKKILKHPLPLLFVAIIFAVSVIGYDVFFKSRQVLGQKSQIVVSTPSPQAQQSPSPSTSPSPASTPSPKLSKSTYTIALFGDSMIDTMGENLDYLKKSLAAKYPGTIFKLYNYGIGSQNVEQGLARWGSAFSYQTRNYPPITQIGADVVIVGSFAYNPFPPHDRNRHFVDLGELVGRAKTTGANVYLLAEIAPLKVGFGKGPGGPNWPEDLASVQAQHIVEQLENAVNLSASDSVSLMNAYEASLYDGKFGNPVYVNQHDGIHPSVQGHVLIANLIARTIKLK